MSLLMGNGDTIVQENIKELMRTGRDEKQATAIALKHAGKSKAPSGKGKPGMKGC